MRKWGKTKPTKLDWSHIDGIYYIITKTKDEPLIKDSKGENTMKALKWFGDKNKNRVWNDSLTNRSFRDILDSRKKITWDSETNLTKQDLEELKLWVSEELYDKILFLINRNNSSVEKNEEKSFEKNLTKIEK
ncbi:hypothetical protein [Mesomycoplasma neurolyticum]|uniref:Uncharacterized protein n=1 Tax=Mesomycoplasma neurolyticum TaxID=2120 RepID=A0A449A633_9BACT|nr:hypothetical protein [Mesomycoplasma neurolyticum]VEU59698.1 Uncharacterised protein [Mesomycoplasma neurolyticum]